VPRAAKIPAKKRGCTHCSVLYSTLDGRCPLCGKLGTENLRNWKGSMPPSRTKIWTPKDGAK
jgi:hypothetical protein